MSKPYSTGSRIYNEPCDNIMLRLPHSVIGKLDKIMEQYPNKFNRISRTSAIIGLIEFYESKNGKIET